MFVLYYIGLFVTDFKQKAQYKFHATKVLLFYILQEESLIKAAYFVNIFYFRKFQDPASSSDSDAQKSIRHCYCYYLW